MAADATSRLQYFDNARRGHTAMAHLFRRDMYDVQCHAWRLTAEIR